jgi:signal transduction histidine kinase
MLRDADGIKFKTEKLQSVTVMDTNIKFFQVFLNLITNAIDSLNESDLQEKEIYLELYPEKNEALFRISDNGPGISRRTMSWFLKVYIQLKRMEQEIGLSESRRLVELHNGTIHINHKISNSCFEIHYPQA